MSGRVLVLALLIATRAYAGIEALGSEDRSAVERAVVEIEHTPDDPDRVFAAGRACEDKLHDPARALALYEWIAHAFPDARVAVPAQRRAEALRAAMGSGNAHAREAGELATLIADADRLAPEQIIARADALANAAWPGAPDAALWLADWLRRTGRYAEAQPRYALVTTRWPDTPQAITALRSGAGNALDAHAWALAEELARALPADAADTHDLLAAAQRGRLRERFTTVAWIALLAAIAGLLASLADATLRGGRRGPALRPPIEVMFFAPIAAVLVAVAFTAHRAIAPAVTLISIGGITMAWLSGASLDLLRARDRPTRLRSVLHVVACVIGVVAIGYLALMRDGLLDMLVETVRFGPDL